MPDYYTPEERRAYMAEYRRKRLAWARAELGGKCVKCGATEDLHFDHIDPATKLGNISTMLHQSRAKFEAEVRKCQLLCGPHHRAKTREARELGQKLSATDVLDVRRRHAAGETMVALGRLYGISPTTIRKCVREQTYR